MSRHPLVQSHQTTTLTSFEEDDEDDASMSTVRSPSSRQSSLLRIAWSYLWRGGYNNNKRTHSLSMGSNDHANQAMDGLMNGERPTRWRHTDRNCGSQPWLSWLKSCLRLSPIIFLSFLGVLHLLQVIFDRTQLFWEVRRVDLFLPKWATDRQEAFDHYSNPAEVTRDVLPIPCHSHNDYWRRVPLYDALRWGATSVEADVWLRDNELYVGHTSSAIGRSRTLTSMYVQPLADLVDQMNSGSANDSTFALNGVFHREPSQTLVLLIDMKTNGHATYPVVHQHLQPLREKGYLSFVDAEGFHSRPITVVGTGNTPFELVLQPSIYRDIFMDAPLHKLWLNPTSEPSPPTILDPAPDFTSPSQISPPNLTTPTPSTPPPGPYNSTNSFYASTNFRSVVGLLWNGHLSANHMRIIRGQIAGAKARGLKSRYWNTPAWPVSLRNHIWHVLMEEGADVLNVDDLKAAAAENWKARIHSWW